MGYILESGDVELLEDDRVKVLKVLPAGSYFGEEVCLGHSERQINVRAKANCRICCLSREDLNPLLDQWPSIRDDMQDNYTQRMEHFAAISQNRDDTKISKRTMMHRDSIEIQQNDGVLIKKSREQHMDERLATLETEVLGITGQLEKLTALMVGIDAKLGGSTGKI